MPQRRKKAPPVPEPPGDEDLLGLIQDFMRSFGPVNALVPGEAGQEFATDIDEGLQGAARSVLGAIPGMEELASEIEDPASPTGIVGGSVPVNLLPRLGTIFHGTSAFKLPGILRQGALLPRQSLAQKGVFMTPDDMMADSFARQKAASDFVELQKQGPASMLDFHSPRDVQTDRLKAILALDETKIPRLEEDILLPESALVSPDPVFLDEALEGVFRDPPFLGEGPVDPQDIIDELAKIVEQFGRQAR